MQRGDGFHWSSPMTQSRLVVSAGFVPRTVYAIAGTKMFQPARRGSAAGGSSHSGGIALLSPCGWGNLGDAAILDSAIDAIRLRLPAAPILGLTLNPADTAQRHGIPALTCSGFSVRDYGVAEDAPFALPVQRGERDAGAPRAPVGTLRATLRQVAWKVPGLSQVWTATKMARADLRHRRLMGDQTGHLSLVVVAGGGQLDDFWGGTFGHPYVLWRWARHSRAVGARFLVLSVGTGVLSTPLSRLLVRRALSVADYRSFRDEGSRQLVGARLVAGDPVVPDLAYGLAPAPSVPLLQERRPLIGLSPIAHRDPRSAPTKDAARYRSYLERLALVAARLLETDHDLVLYATASADIACVSDLRLEIAKRVTPEQLERISTPETRTVADLRAALAPVRVALASRLHGVILPHVWGIPVVALSYERKVTVLMQTMNCQSYCVDIDEFAPSLLLQLTYDLLDKQGAMSRNITRLVAGFRRQVDAQYDLVFRERST